MPVKSTQDVAAMARGRRLDLGLSQADLARQAHVSRKWIYEFEQGKPRAEFGLVLSVLDALGLSLEILREGAPTDSSAIDLDAILARLEPDSETSA